MINTTRDIRQILEGLSNMCTDKGVEMILQKARKEITNYLVTNLPEPDDEEKRLNRMGHKIEAIKSYRLRTGASLRDAKDIIDNIP